MEHGEYSDEEYYEENSGDMSKEQAAGASPKPPPSHSQNKSKSKANPKKPPPAELEVIATQSIPQNEEDKQFLVQKLETQNQKLKNEFDGLKKKLEECLEKAKKNKKDKRLGYRDREEHNEDIKMKEQELKGSQQKIQFYKRQIVLIKKQLEGSYNIDKIVALENEAKDKERILEELEKEKTSLLRIQREQEKALEEISNSKDFKARKKKITSELDEVKKALREKQGDLRKNEKIMKEQHEKLITLEEKCKKLHVAIKDKKAKGSQTDQPTKHRTQEDLDKLDQEIHDLEGKKKVEEKKFKKTVETQEHKIGELQMQINLLNMQLKEKDQECRLNGLKINELKRQVRHNLLKPMENQSMGKQAIGTQGKQGKGYGAKGKHKHTKHHVARAPKQDKHFEEDNKYDPEIEEAEMEDPPEEGDPEIDPAEKPLQEEERDIPQEEVKGDETTNKQPDEEEIDDQEYKVEGEENKKEEEEEEEEETPAAYSKPKFGVKKKKK